MSKPSSPEIFSHDVATHGGYVYSTDARLSCRLSNRRMSEAIHAAADFRAARVLDVGCGDGTYTLDLLALQPAAVLGVDPSAEAIAAAQKRTPPDEARIRFAVGSAYELGGFGDGWDVAVVRGVLHHLDEPERAVREVARAARRLVVLEPNGSNPVLKVIERTSRYHVEHAERSYRSGTLEAWIRAEGGRVVARSFIGLVPMFCPDWMARALKVVEPLVERIPAVRAVGCGQVVIVADF
jgi:SAM-dependent methyltransferase